MSKPKLADVNWLTVTLLPQTICQPPTGTKCYLERGSSNFSAQDAKRHALEHPGHVVERSAITRTRYELAPNETSRL